MRRFSLIALLLLTGLVAGLVLSGTADNRESVLARPGAEAPAAQPAAAPALPAAGVGGPDFTRVAAQTVKAVTNISSVQVVRRQTSPFANDPFFQYFFGDQGEMFGRPRAESSLGSGVVISQDGYVVTNNHVVGDGDAEVTVTVGDYRDVRAKVVGVDSWTDLALLKIDVTGLPVIPYGDSSKLRVAEWVMAVGSPFSLSQTVTVGVVSALGRANVGITQYEDFIQTDAAINPGNSGGALINSRAELVGINTAIFSQSGGYQGIGFAVPSNLVRRVVGDLMKYGQVRRGSIGYVEVMPLTSRLADELRAPKTDGIVVNQMARASAAYRAGLQPGDVILSANGQAIADPSQFVRLIADSAIGSTVRIEVLRDGARSTLRIPIEAQQERRQRRQ
ncbi:MAG: trypsin-like peptidase domain-containing protein [Vicinamibacterales bacterium]|jgi:Do/DeqQ family serine protease